MIAGFSPLSHSQVMPSRSRLPGPRFSTTTSAFGTMRANSSLPRGSRIFSVTLRLLALRMMKYQASGPFGSAPRPRPGSPRPGCSILITLAPSQASICVQDVPASYWVRSSTVRFASGLAIGQRLPARRRRGLAQRAGRRTRRRGARPAGARRDPPHHTAARPAWRGKSATRCTMPTVEIERDGAIRTLTLNRPEKRNALDGAMLAAIVAEFSRPPEPQERAAVIRANGPVFCSGIDLRQRVSGERPERWASIETAVQAIEQYPLPVVAVVQGDAIAGGNELALHCDLVVASTAARFGMPLAQIGLALHWPLV